MGPAGAIILGLILAAPLVRMLTEIAFGPVRWSWRNLGLGYLAFLLRILFLLGIQFAAVPAMFLLGPVWLLMSLLTLVDLTAHVIPGLEPAPSPVLCYWAGIAEGLCLPAELLYHGLSAAGLYLWIRHGNRLLDAGVILPYRLIRGLEARMDS